MFTGGSKQASPKVKRRICHHFLNITRIMDCVECEKDKVRGNCKLKAAQGLGTALY